MWSVTWPKRACPADGIGPDRIGKRYRRRRTYVGGLLWSLPLVDIKMQTTDARLASSRPWVRKWDIDTPPIITWSRIYIQPVSLWIRHRDIDMIRRRKSHNFVPTGHVLWNCSLLIIVIDLITWRQYHFKFIYCFLILLTYICKKSYNKLFEKIKNVQVLNDIRNPKTSTQWYIERSYQDNWNSRFRFSTIYRLMKEECVSDLYNILLIQIRKLLIVYNLLRLANAMMFLFIEIIKFVALLF